MRGRKKGSRRAKAGWRRERSAAGKAERVGSLVLMENDREWVAEFAGGAWAGHNGDRGGCAGRLAGLFLAEVQVRMEKLCAG